MSTADFDSYFAIPQWAEPTAAEAAYFNAADWSSSGPSMLTSTDDIYTMSPKIGAMMPSSTSVAYSPLISFTSSNHAGIAGMKSFALAGDPDSKEERGARTATGVNAADAWASIVKDTNYGFNGSATATAPCTAFDASASVAAAAAEDVDTSIIEQPRAVTTGAPCTAPSGTVWLSVGDAMDRTKQHVMWECVSDKWTRVPTVWKNSETSVLSINATMSIMSAAALAKYKREFKKSYVPGSLQASATADLAAQRVAAPTVAIAGVTPMMEPVTAPILLAEPPKKSGRGGGRKRCTLFPKEIKVRGAPEPLLTPTGRVRKQSVKKSTYVKKDPSMRKNAKKVKEPVGVVDKKERKNARRMRTNAKEIHHVTVAAAAAIAAIPVNVAAAAATPSMSSAAAIAAPTAGAYDIPDISAFDFEEEIDTRPGRGNMAAAVDAAFAIGTAVAQRATTKMVTKVVYEEYLVDDNGNEVMLAGDGTLNGVPVNIRDEADVVR